LPDLCGTVTLTTGPSILQPAYINLKKFKAPTQRYYRKINPPNIFNVMRTFLLMVIVCLGLSCTTNNSTYNCTCDCKCDMGSHASPSDTICVKTDVDSVTVETEQVEEGN